MEAAEERAGDQRALVWWGANIPFLKKPLTLEKFVGAKPGRKGRAIEFHAAWDKIDRALARGRTTR